MSRIVYFDCASGVSGDMLLGALVDLGWPIEELRAGLAKLALSGYRVETSVINRGGIRATKVDVLVGGGEGHDADHDHDHAHDHHHGHDHGHKLAKKATHGPHAHRGLTEILGILAASALAPSVKERAASLFRRLADVEAGIHGTTADQVHFHEVGAVDSIVDIVGGVLGLEWLGADRFAASALNVGSGTVETAHGTLPVPAPATACLLAGVPVYGAGAGELTTPTGALMVSGYASAYGALPAMRVERIGYGAGGRETAGRPNVLRMLVGESIDNARATETVLVLETEIDDMSPQLLAPLIDRLLSLGAFDAYFAPVFMKKGRPGVLLTILAPPARRAELEGAVFAETTTIGVRWQEWQRTCLERRIVSVTTPYGAIRVKQAVDQGRVVNAQPEFEDCARAAREGGVAVKEVWAAAVAAYRQSTDAEAAGRG